MKELLLSRLFLPTAVATTTTTTTTTAITVTENTMIFMKKLLISSVVVFVLFVNLPNTALLMLKIVLNVNAMINVKTTISTTIDR
jgi:hypothetical protein